MNRLRTFLIWLTLIVVLLVAVIVAAAGSSADFEQRALDSFIQDLERHDVQEVVVDNKTLTVYLYDGQIYQTHIQHFDESLANTISKSGAYWDYGAEDQDYSWRSTLLFLIAALAFFGAVVLFLMRRFQARSNNTLVALRESRARLVGENSAVRFDDVAGCEEAKERLGDIISYMRNPDPWKEAGVRLPRGVLLEGPPGCGKTLLARAVAGEVDAKFFTVAASEFVELFVGVGATRMRDMFENAIKEAPAIIFIDEIDAVGRKRGSGIGGSHDEREQTLNQLLVCLDGFEADSNVVVLAATNRADVLDPALMRPGRFDARITVGVPDRKGRLAALVIHSKNKRFSDDISLEEIADLTPEYTGADIEHLCNESAVLAVRRSIAEKTSAMVTMADIQPVLDKRKNRRSTLNQLDATMVESASQLAKPTGKAFVAVTLTDEMVVEGELIWANSGFLKVAREDGNALLIPKFQIRHLEALEGTEDAAHGDGAADRWAQHLTDTA